MDLHIGKFLEFIWSVRFRTWSSRNRTPSKTDAPAILFHKNFDWISVTMSVVAFLAADYTDYADGVGNAPRRIERGFSKPAGRRRGLAAAQTGWMA